MLDIEAAKAAFDQARREYADQMDHVAKFARADCDQVRAGFPMDSLSGISLRHALRAFRRVEETEAVLRAARGERMW